LSGKAELNIIESFLLPFGSFVEEEEFEEEEDWEAFYSLLGVS